MSQIVLNTTLGARIHPYNDSIIAYMAKGGDESSGAIQNYLSSLKLGKPYGILKTSYVDPLGLEFDEASKSIYLKPGLFMAFGRLCEVPERGLVKSLASEAFTTTDKVYYTVYALIDVNDSTKNDAQIMITSASAYPENFDSLQDQDDLFVRKYGAFRMPIGQFSYKVTNSEGSRFADYKKIPTEYEIGTRQIAKRIDASGQIGGSSISQIFEIDENGRNTASFNNASNEESTELFDSEYENNGMQRYSAYESIPGYSIADEASNFGTLSDNAEIGSDLAGVLTYKRFKLLDLTKDFGTEAMDQEVEVDCDWDHLVAIKFFFDGFKIFARCSFEDKAVASFGGSGWFGGGSEYEKTYYTDVDGLEEVPQEEGDDSKDRPRVKVRLGGSYGLLANYDKMKTPFGVTDFADRSVEEYRYQIYGNLNTFGDHTCRIGIGKSSWSENYERYIPEGIDSYHYPIDLIGIHVADFNHGGTVYGEILVSKNGNGKKAKIKLKGEGDSGWIYQWLGLLSFHWNDYRPLAVDYISGSMWIEFLYEGDVFGD